MNKEEIYNYLNCWIKWDLKHLGAIHSNPKGCGGCNYPITLYILSCMEWLGFLTRKCKINLVERKGTKKNIVSILDYFPKQYQTNKDIYGKILADVFRHGLSHQFFPKIAGVSRYENRELAIFKYNGTICLDADTLADHFLLALVNIQIQLEDSDFLQQFNDKWSFLAEEDLKIFNKYSDDINKLDNYYSITNTTTTVPPNPSETKK